MDMISMIFITVAVTGMGLGITLLINNLGAKDKRKLKQRLGSDSQLENENRGAQSLLLISQSTGLPAFLNRLPVFQKMQRWLARAYPDAKVSRFLLVAAMFAIVPPLAVQLITENSVMAVLAFAIGLFPPMLFVNSKRTKRQRLMIMQLPEALDFLSRVLRSGQSFSTAMQMMSEELPQPLAGEFGRCYDQHSLGQSIEDGLRDMAIKIDSSDFSFFTTAVIIQRQTGGDLAEVLHNISDMIRKRIRLAQTVRAKTAEGRFTGYVMIAFPAIMFAVTYFIDPVRGDVMLKTSTGHMLIGVAIGLETFGFFLIKKITTINV